MRLVTVNDNGVIFGEQLDYGSKGRTNYGIPYHILRLKLSVIE